jgi:dihydroorotate dehydrogenase
MLKLRGTNFGGVLQASGVGGFFGEGYWYHRILKCFGLNFDGSTFVAKTTTLEPRQGNMPLKKDGITPKEWFPECIKVYPRQKMVLNAVGLSGPGAEALFETGRWQARKKPFFISFMAVGPTPEDRLRETKSFVGMFAHYLPDFKGKVGLQINYSCPNTGLDPDCLVDEATAGLAMASSLNVPLVPKFSIATPTKAIKKVSADKNCDAICISNTIPWRKLPEWIDWIKLFGSTTSPLEKWGGGGLSGKHLLPAVINWLRHTETRDIRKPIIAGGGVLCPRDVSNLYSGINNPSAASIGSIAILCPWNVQETIIRGNRLFG